MAKNTSIVYSPEAIDAALRQGEIPSNLTTFEYQPDSGEVLPRTHELALVASQDCDLDWDYKFRTGQIQGEDKRLEHVLVFRLHGAASVRSRTGMNSKFWERIKINKDERFHFLEAVPPDAERAGRAIGEMTVDFKGYFTVPTDEVYRQLRAGTLQRRCRILGPYREHLQSRMMYFQSRIALPAEHHSQPES